MDFRPCVIGLEPPAKISQLMDIVQTSHAKDDAIRLNHEQILRHKPRVGQHMPVQVGYSQKWFGELRK